MGSRGSNYEDNGMKSNKEIDKKELMKQLRDVRDEFEKDNDVIYNAVSYNKYDKYLTRQGNGITRINGVPVSKLTSINGTTEEMTERLEIANEYSNRLKNARKKFVGKEIKWREKLGKDSNGNAKIEYSKGRVVKVYHDNFLFGGSPFVRVEYDVDFGNGKKDKHYINVRLDEIERMNK